MGYMKAIATDVEELVITIGRTDKVEELPDAIRGTGWVTPTEAWLVRQLLTDDQKPATIERCLAILGNPGG